MNHETGVIQVHIEDIIPNRFQPRLNFDEQGLKELSDSIKEHGIIQPLVLRRLGDKYEIIAGERRYKAAQLAGLSTVPAVISNIDDNTSAEVALVENIQRRDLTSIEEARSYKNLLDKGYLTQEQLAKKMGLSQPAIANKLRLLNLDEEVQQALLEEKISERHARTLLSIKNKEEQKEWLHRIINERLTVRQLDMELKKTGFNLTSEEEQPVEEKEVKITPQSALSTTTNGIETLDEIEPLDNENKLDFNIETPDSITNLNETYKKEEPTNKFFGMGDNDSKEIVNEEPIKVEVNDSNFIDLQNKSNISNLNMVYEPPKEESKPMDIKYEDSINISSNNKFFTPIKDTSLETTTKKDDDIIDPMDIAAELSNDTIWPRQEKALKTAINEVRKCVSELEKMGFAIKTDELDQTDNYQIIIDIKKEGN